MNPFYDRFELTPSRLVKLITIGFVNLSYGSQLNKIFPSIFIVPFRLLLSACLTFIQIPFYYALTLSVPAEKTKDWYFYSASWQKHALKVWLEGTNIFFLIEHYVTHP